VRESLALAKGSHDTVTCATCGNGRKSARSDREQNALRVHLRVASTPERKVTMINSGRTL